MRADILILALILPAANSLLWLPFANFGSMFETLKEAAFKHSMETNEDNPLSHISILDFGRDLISGLGKFLSNSFDESEKLHLAKGLREIFNVSTTPPSKKRIIPKLFPVTATPPSTRISTTKKPTTPMTFPPYVPPIPNSRFKILTTTTTTEEPITKFTKSTSRPTTTTTEDEIIRFTTSAVKTTSTPAVTTTTYPIWPTTSKRAITWKPLKPTITELLTTTEPIYTKAKIPWKKITPSPESFSTTMEPIDSGDSESPENTMEMLPIDPTSAPVPQFLKTLKYTRPPVPEEIPMTTMPSLSQKAEVCRPGTRCSINLKSFETSDPVFQYCYSHSTMIDEFLQEVLKETQSLSYPTHISWHQSVPPEVLQLTQSLLDLYRPSRCLVIGVFTGIGLLGIAEHVDPRGIVVALEHPGYAIFWERVGQKYAKKMTESQHSRIQMKASESIERSLAKLASNEPNTFDFVFLDDVKKENYLDNYELSVRLMRRGGLLIINQVLNNGGVLSGVENMTNEDKVLRNLNIRIKQDPRVRASLLPYAGGTWIITKN